MQIISRKDAKEQNLTHYYTGSPCKHGHINVRFTSNGDCIKCSENRRTSEHGKRMFRNLYIETREKRLKKASENYQKKSDAIKEYQKVYRQRNKDKLNEKHGKRYKSDPEYRLRFTVRNIIRKQLIRIGKEKELCCSELLGYSPSELKRHLERQFVDGMNWDNYGEWHIDHIVPIDAFIKLGVHDVKVINSLENLQPLWACDNLSKGNRIDVK